MPEGVLVTGGAGFIGAHLVGELVRSGARVKVLDNLSTGRRQRVDSGAEFIEGDVRERDAVARALVGVDQVVHLAARVTIRGSVDAVREDHDVNLGGTLTVLEAMRGSQVRRFVNASSMAVYGDNVAGARVGEGAVAHPLSPYGASKLAAEHYVRLACEASGVACCNLRFFNTWGPGQRLTPYVGVITIFLDRIRQGLAPKIFGDGSQTRDFIHVSDVVAACQAALQRDLVGAPSLNVGTGRGTSVAQVAALAAEALGSRAAAVHEAARPEELQHCVADPSAALAHLGFSAKRSLTAQALCELAQSSASA